MAWLTATPDQGGTVLGFQLVNRILKGVEPASWVGCRSKISRFCIFEAIGSFYDRILSRVPGW